MTIPYSCPSTIPGCTHRAVIHFNDCERMLVLAISKRLRSATVTQVFHTALALALRDYQPLASPHIKEGNYVSDVMMNLRRSCKEPFNGYDYSMTVCHTNSVDLLAVPVPLLTTNMPDRQDREEFTEVLEKVKALYVDHCEPDLMSAPLCFAARTPAYTFSSTFIPFPDRVPSVLLSSPGTTDDFIKHDYSRFEVLDPWVVGTELSPGYSVSVAECKYEFLECNFLSSCYSWCSSKLIRYIYFFLKFSQRYTDVEILIPRG